MLVKRNPPPRKKKNLSQRIILDNKVRLVFPYILENEIRSKFTMRNPEYLAICKRRRLKMSDRPRGYIVAKEKKDGRWTSRKINEWLYYYEFDGSDLVVPRGGFNIVKKIFMRHGVKYKIINKRTTLGTTDFKFKGKLKKSKGQHLFKKYSVKNGILQAGTGTGKTVMSLYKVAQINQPTIIIIDTTELLEQWKSRITIFLGIPENKIGHVGGGIEKIESITVALMQTLRDRLNLLDHFGMMIVDECHIVATESYERIINNFKGEYVMGLSATPRRRDGKTRVMLWLLGGIHLAINRESVEKLPAAGIFVSSTYNGEINFRRSYSTAKSLMLQDETRNKLIIDTIINNVDIYGIHLIISSSSKHLETLIDLMPHHFKLTAKLLIGKVSRVERKKIVAQAMKNKVKFIFATDRLIGKGFDEELMSVLHLTSPVADPDAFEQFFGRVTRVPENKEVKKRKKKAYIFYYFDYKETVLRGAASTCSKKFHELGIEKSIQRNG